MTIFSGSDNRITKDHPIGLYHLRLHFQSLIQPFLIPESSKAARQMSACRKSGNSDPLYIYIPLISMFTYQLHGKRQLHKCPWKYIRHQAVVKHKDMKTSCQILHSDRLIFTSRKFMIAAARTKQDSRSFFIRDPFYWFQDISSKICRSTKNRISGLFRIHCNRNMFYFHMYTSFLWKDYFFGKTLILQKKTATTSDRPVLLFQTIFVYSSSFISAGSSFPCVICFLIAWKLWALSTCSILQASSTAVFSSTPR